MEAQMEEGLDSLSFRRVEGLWLSYAVASIFRFLVRGSGKTFQVRLVVGCRRSPKPYIGRGWDVGFSAQCQKA